MLETRVQQNLGFTALYNIAGISLAALSLCSSNPSLLSGHYGQYALTSGRPPGAG